MIWSAVALRWESGLSDTNIRPVLIVVPPPPPEKAITVSTAGSDFDDLGQLPDPVPHRLE